METVNPLNVLISLHRGYGLGDAVQMSAVLRHVAKYRPDWLVDFQAEAGRHCVGRGIVANTFEFGHNPDPDKHYGAEVEMYLYDRWYGWGDRPNTRVSSCLHECFGLPWDAECGRYQVNVSNDARLRALYFLDSISDEGFVAVHYRGDSSKKRKDLTDGQAVEIMRLVSAAGRTPLVLDWRGACQHLPPCARSVGWYMSTKGWGGDAEMNCAVISQCKAFVGIDSGPAKCASATDTPTLVVWTGHHPALFHDPAPNTTHLVPRGYHGLEPVCNDRDVVDWFEAHYSVRQYDGDPVGEVKKWLQGVLA